MSDSRNMILAVILSMLILGAWYYFVDLPHLEKAREQQRIAATQAKPAATATVAQPVQNTPLPRTEAVKGARVRVESDFLHGSINLKGARFDDLTLARFHETIDPASPEVVLLSPSRTEKVYFAEFGWLPAEGTQVSVPGPETLWQASGQKLTPEKPLTLTWQSPEGLRFTLLVRLDEHYMFTVEQSVQNLSGKAVKLLPYGLINRVHTAEKEEMISHIGPVAVLNGTLHEVTYEDLQEQQRTGFEKTSGWLGMGDKYWLTALVPQGRMFDANFSYAPVEDQPRYQADYLGEAQEVPAGGRWDATTHFFAGAKKVGLLDQYAESYEIPFFDRAVDFGWLYFLTKPIFKALQFFYLFFGNFGLAILALTVVVKLLLFPLANKSYRSMNQMKELAPEIQRLREEYKNDKMRLNQEIMDFYKRKKINPMAGCLPILVQIPIFFALYKVLFITIEMRHAPFYGWIHDLSAPDPTSLFNLFGLLPYDVPAFLHIGVWPLLMGLTMYLQQLINPPPSDPVQAKVMKLLPVVFTVMLAAFPAGLVIYWTWSNTLSILQQRLLAGGLKRQQAKSAA